MGRITMSGERPVVRVEGKLEWVGPWQPGQPLPKELVRELAEILAQMLVADLKEHSQLVATKVPTPTPTSQQNLSIAEAAKRLGVSPHLIRRWVTRREIPFIKLGRRVVFATKDVEEFEARHRMQAKTKTR